MQVQRGLLGLECAALLLLAAAWVGTVLRLHAQPSGVAIEFLLVGLLFLATHARRGLAAFGLGRAEGNAARGLEGLALLALLSSDASVALFPATLLALGHALRAPDKAEVATLTPLRALGRAAALLGLVSLVWATWRGLPLGWARLSLALPVGLEAALGADRSTAAALRRLAAGSLLGVLAWARLDHLLAVAVAVVLCASSLVALRAGRREPAERAQDWRRATLRGAAVAMVLGLALLGLEVGVRALADAPDRLPPEGGHGLQHVPGATFVYEGGGLQARQATPNVVVWNRLGMHDLDHEAARPAGTVRVLVLGDSYVEGRQVPRESLVHRVLERELAARSGAKVECIALGRSGWGQAEELEALEKDGLAFDPDLVLVEFLCWNDVTDNLPELDALAAAQDASMSPVRPLLADALRKRLAGLGWALERTDALLARAEEPLHTDAYRETPRRHTDLWRRAWERTGELVRQLRERTQGRELALVVFSSSAEVAAAVAPATQLEPGEVDLRRPARRIAEVCREQAIPCLDLPPRFSRLPIDARDRLHLRADEHWSVEGHEAAAREAARFLCEETPLWRRAAARALERR